MGLPVCTHYLEVKSLKLTAEKFPLPCSLRKLVLDRYAAPGESQAPAMEQQELLACLSRIDDPELPPMESILAWTRETGNPTLPGSDQIAILTWIDVAFSEWEQQFGLDEPLGSELRRLKPLAAALAITDADFFTPGGHPLHHLIDTVQQSAIGWQRRLGRAGQALEKQVADAVSTALTWFDVDGIDLGDICAQVAFTAERDHARAGRMSQRLIEAEQGRIKTAEAKRLAAHTINTALAQYEAPASIIEFLKGPWYDSAQLVLLKFGRESDQWRQMSKTTITLLDSLNVPETEEGDRRQYLFEVVNSLPKELTQWLLSLQHHSDAIDEAIEAIEFAHLRVLQQQPLDLQRAEPIQIVENGPMETGLHDVLAAIEAGQWFAVDTGRPEMADDGPLRARLVLRMDAEQQLIFANQAGVKALQQSFAEFASLLASGKASPLASGASFSRSLASSSGISTTEDLDEFIEVAAKQARREQEQRLQRQREEAERLQREQEEAERLQREQEEAERLQREREEAERLQREREEAERLQREREAAQHMKTDNSSSPPAGSQDIELSLPMGAWLGFHDGNTPLMAKLAVYDVEQDVYTFVNRNGIKMRQLSRQELLALVDDGLVDILEARSSFRDEVTRVRTESED